MTLLGFPRSSLFMVHASELYCLIRKRRGRVLCTDRSFYFILPFFHRGTHPLRNVGGGRSPIQAPSQTGSPTVPGAALRPCSGTCSSHCFQVASEGSHPVSESGGTLLSFETPKAHSPHCAGGNPNPPGPIFRELLGWHYI